jgi:hypothetical protein
MVPGIKVCENTVNTGGSFEAGMQNSGFMPGVFIDSGSFSRKQYPGIGQQKGEQIHRIKRNLKTDRNKSKK